MARKKDHTKSPEEEADETARVLGDPDDDLDPTVEPVAPFHDPDMPPDPPEGSDAKASPAGKHSLAPQDLRSWMRRVETAIASLGGKLPPA